MSQLLERNPALQLDLLGHLELPLVLLPHRGQFRCHPFSDYTYLRRIAEADIGWWPWSLELYTDKSAIRWMEFSISVWPACLAHTFPSACRRAFTPGCAGHRRLGADGGAVAGGSPRHPCHGGAGPAPGRSARFPQAETFWTPLVQQPAAQALVGRASAPRVVGAERLFRPRALAVPGLPRIRCGPSRSSSAISGRSRWLHRVGILAGGSGRAR